MVWGRILDGEEHQVLDPCLTRSLDEVVIAVSIDGGGTLVLCPGKPMDCRHHLANAVDRTAYRGRVPYIALGDLNVCPGEVIRPAAIARQYANRKSPLDQQAYDTGT
jgi:hypothetical protein